MTVLSDFVTEEEEEELLSLLLPDQVIIKTKHKKEEKAAKTDILVDVPTTQTEEGKIHSNTIRFRTDIHCHCQYLMLST